MTLEAEQRVIGSVLLEPASYFRASDLLTPLDFTSALHADLWRTFAKLHDAERPIDVFTVADAMQTDDAGYVIELASTTPTSANIRTYAERVRESTTKRRVQLAGLRIGAQGDLAEAQQLIAAITDDQPGRLITARDANKAMFAGVMERYERHDDFAGLQTGIPQLDELTGGLQKGRVYALGARAKMGKSMLAWQIAAHVALAGQPVTGFSLEMPADELMQRMACCIGKVRSGGLLRPKLMNPDEWSRLSSAIGQLNGAPLKLSDRMDSTIDQIEAQVRQSKPALVVIDYLQLIEQPKLETEAVRLSYITRRVKKLAKDCDVPVIEVFQVNRGNERDSHVRVPRPSDAKGSGSIEQDCDAMLLLHRPSYYDQAASKGLRLELAIQRNGPTGIIRMEDELDRCRFAPTHVQWVDSKKQAAGDNDL